MDRKVFIYLMLALVTAAFSPASAFAKPAVALDSSVFVEKIVERNGQQSIRLETPEQVLPGDQLIFVLRYRNTGRTPVSNFIITNPLPETVSFQETLDGTEQVSIDGGQNWGDLESLTIAAEDGDIRPALPSDVTHIRWKILQNITERSEGKLTFRGVVKGSRSLPLL